MLHRPRDRSVSGRQGLLYYDDVAAPSSPSGPVDLDRLGDRLHEAIAHAEEALQHAPEGEVAEPLAAVASRKSWQMSIGALAAIFGLLLLAPLSTGTIPEGPALTLVIGAGPIALLLGIWLIHRGIKLRALTVDQDIVQGGEFPYPLELAQVERVVVTLDGQRSSVILEVGIRLHTSRCTREEPLLALLWRVRKLGVPALLLWHATFASEDPNSDYWVVVLKGVDDEGGGSLLPLKEAERVHFDAAPLDGVAAT